MCSIGIDLGTTYSCVAALLNGQVEVIPDDQGLRITNSCVAFTNDGDTLVGSTAVHQHSENVINTTYDVKRLIGRKFSDESVQADMENYLYDVVDDDGNPKIRIRYLTGGAVVFAPEEISAMVLREMKTIAQCYIGEDKKIESVVITVPAHFNDAQRRATKLAAEIAGIKSARMINEPTAAALAYGLEKKAKGKRNVVIYDLGGGTFDATVLTITDGCFQVKATGGDAHLGGQDFNLRLYNHFRRIFLKNTKLDISQDHNARQKLFAECERVKRLLSFQDRVEAHIPSLFEDIDFTAKITRARFEHLNDDLFRGTMGTIEEVLREANLTKEEIDDVVLVGGSTRIPFVRELLSEHFDKTDLCKDINPDEAVAYGAAVHAAMSYGTIIPEMTKLSLHDVTSLSLGIEEKGFNMDFLIKRNTNIPTKASRTFITSRDGQSSIEYKIFEGERPLTNQNKYLGSVSLTNLPALPAGKVKTKLIFEIDGNGVLQVKAYDKSNPDNKKNMTIKWDKGRWSEEEIQKMINDAEKYRVVDDIQKRILTCRSSLQNTACEALQVATGTQGTKKQRTKLRDQAQDSLNWLSKTPDVNIFHLKRKQKQMDEAFRHFKSKI